MEAKLKSASAMLKLAKDKAKRVAEDGSQKSSELLKTMKAKAQNMAAAGARYAAGEKATPPPALPPEATMTQPLISSEENAVAVQSLYALGFSMAAARHALLKCGGDVDAAGTWLLDPDNADEILAAELAQQATSGTASPEKATATDSRGTRDVKDLMNSMAGDLAQAEGGEDERIALRNQVREILIKTGTPQDDAAACVDALTTAQLYELIASVSGDADPQPETGSSCAAAAGPESSAAAAAEPAKPADPAVEAIQLQMDSMLEELSPEDARLLQKVEDSQLQQALAASLSEKQARELQKEVDDVHQSIAQKEELVVVEDTKAEDSKASAAEGEPATAASVTTAAVASEASAAAGSSAEAETKAETAAEKDAEPEDSQDKTEVDAKPLEEKSAAAEDRPVVESSATVEVSAEPEEKAVASSASEEKPAIAEPESAPVAPAEKDASPESAPEAAAEKETSPESAPEATAEKEASPESVVETAAEKEASPESAAEASAEKEKKSPLPEVSEEEKKSTPTEAPSQAAAEKEASPEEF